MCFFKKHRKGKKKNKHIGKIGWCDGSVLGLSKGHYVYIRNVKNGKCEVNTFTSLERNNGNFKIDKINQVRKGNIFAVSKRDLNLPKFSGLDSRVIKNISIHDIKDKGRYRIKARYRDYIKQFVK